MLWLLGPSTTADCCELFRPPDVPFSHHYTQSTPLVQSTEPRAHQRTTNADPAPAQSKEYKEATSFRQSGFCASTVHRQRPLSEPRLAKASSVTTHRDFSSVNNSLHLETSFVKPIQRPSLQVSLDTSKITPTLPFYIHHQALRVQQQHARSFYFSRSLRIWLGRRLNPSLSSMREAAQPPKRNEDLHWRPR